MTDFTDRKNEALTNQKVKSLIDFDEEYSSSIRYKINSYRKKFKGKFD